MAEAKSAADGDAEVVIFRHSVAAAESIEEAAEQNPGYVKIYLNARKEGSRTVLSLSRDSGESLYILSNKDYPDCRAYLQGGIKSAKAFVPENSSATFSSRKNKLDDSSGSSIKKVKQKSLLNFFGKR